MVVIECARAEQADEAGVSLLRGTPATLAAMNRLPQIVGALGVLSLVLSLVWTPWIAAATLALMCAWLLRQLLRRDQAALELLREAQGPERSFAEVMTIVRGKLRDSEQHLKDRDAEIAQRKQITNAVPDGLFLLDERDHIIWCNQAALVMHSLDAFRDMGKPISQMIRAPEFAAYLDDDSRPEPLVTQGGRSILFHLERGKDEGSDGRQRSRLLLTRDVTERERLDRMRRDFVANVSHELRTPLTVVGGFVETLTELSVTVAERDRYLQLISTQTANMRRLVEDLLTLARLENDQIPPESTPTDIAQIAHDALSDAEALSNGQHTFVARIESAEVPGSAAELRSALNNLLSNAVRYTPAGGQISLTVSGGDTVIVEIKDSGIGINAEHIPRLTERFYRIDRSRSRETGGTGLGLAIVKHVALRHHAQFEIESCDHGDARGSLFRLRFPAAAA